MQQYCLQINDLNHIELMQYTCAYYNTFDENAVITTREQPQYSLFSYLESIRINNYYLIFYYYLKCLLIVLNIGHFFVFVQRIFYIFAVFILPLLARLFIGFEILRLTIISRKWSRTHI